MRSSTWDVTNVASAARAAASGESVRVDAKTAIEARPSIDTATYAMVSTVRTRMSVVLSVEPDTDVTGSSPNSTAPARKPMPATTRTARNTNTTTVTSLLKSSHERDTGRTRR